MHSPLNAGSQNCSGVKFMGAEVIANQNCKENRYLAFEEVFKVWRHNNPLPSFEVYAGTYMAEEDNLELFDEGFEETFDKFLLTVFKGELDDKEAYELNKQMRIKYGDKGTEVNAQLDNAFKRQYRPTDWMLAVIQDIIHSDEIKQCLIKQLEKPQAPKINLQAFMRKKIRTVFLTFFGEDSEYSFKYYWKDKDFRSKLYDSIAEFIKQHRQQNIFFNRPLEIQSV